MLLSRRRTLQLSAGFAGAAFAAAWPRVGEAQMHAVYRKAEPIRIAIPEFLPGSPGDAEAARTVTQIITDNLRRSGEFKPTVLAARIEKTTDFDAAPDFAEWKANDADFLIVGRIGRHGGRVQADLRLWSVPAGAQLSGRQFVSTSDDLRRVGHVMSDHVYAHFIGERGNFDSRIVFLDEDTSRETRESRIAIMDQDGANFRHLTPAGDVVFSPSFSPSGQQVVYTVFRDGGSRVMLLDLDSGKADVLGAFRGPAVVPRVSPDGQRVVVGVGQGLRSRLHVIDLRSREVTPLTDADIRADEPSYSPDGSRICFTAERFDGFEIHVMAAIGGPSQRISFSEGFYMTPAWSPRGDMIAFTKRVGGRYVIGVMRPDGQGERILTQADHSALPTFAPNGRVLMFFRNLDRAPDTALLTINVDGTNEQPVPTPRSASQAAWSPLLS